MYPACNPVGAGWHGQPATLCIGDCILQRPPAWQFDVSRAALKRESGDPSLHRFWAWLVRESEQGRVQRQEAVSMVPPLLLDVRRGHQVRGLLRVRGCIKT
jgi:hypothetical protein